jgi:MerR family transcriptional regulator, thiopeptide resistance regulator
MGYTVKQLADLAGVSIRTLHYYDEIGLLKPASYGENGYRYYDEPDVLRLQQILFFRELDFSLDDIKDILDRPEFDVLRTLEGHRQALEQKVTRLNRLINTVDNTISHLKGELEMSQKGLFEGFTEEKQKEYEQQARHRYGDAEVQESTERWNRYTQEKKEKIKAEGEAVYRDILANMDNGYDSPEVQQAIARWRQHLRYFYEPSYERLMGLAQLYREDPDFVATYQKMHPDMPQFLYKAIEFYCKGKTGSV